MTEFTITQLTNNNLDDDFPQLSGNNVVWNGNDGNDEEIFFYNGSEVIQITNNEQFDGLANISGNNIAWFRSETDPIESFEVNEESISGEVILYDGNTETVIGNSGSLTIPLIAGENIVWGDITTFELFLYDGNENIQLSNFAFFASLPNSLEDDTVAWQGQGAQGGSQIFLYDGNETIQITDNNLINATPITSGGNVAWIGATDPDNPNTTEVFFYDGTNTTQLTDNNVFDFVTGISDNKVVWTGNDGNDNEIFLYDGNAVIKLTDNNTDDREPFISGDNIVWEGNDGNDVEIYFYDGSTVTQVTDNDTEDINPQISGNNIVWEGNDGNDVEIFFATADLSISDVAGDSAGTTVYRFFNSNTGVHFYTADENERDIVREIDTFIFEGDSYKGVDPLSGASEALPVYRFLNQNTGVHLYTVSENERDAVQQLDNFSFEGEVFSAYDTQVEGTIPIYRFFNPTTEAHFYTPSSSERDNVLDNLSDFQSEGIAYYALPAE